MGYFTETINMLLEFRGDAQAYHYYKRREQDQNSMFGKNRISTNAAENINNGKEHSKVKTAQDYKNYVNGREYKNHINSRNEDDLKLDRKTRKICN